MLMLTIDNIQKSSLKVGKILKQCSGGEQSSHCHGTHQQKSYQLARLIQQRLPPLSEVKNRENL